VPVFAGLLARAKLRDWAQQWGRVPGPDDLVAPCPNRWTGEPQRWLREHALRKLHEDLDRIAWRRRNIRDLRRTFISLLRSDGGNTAIVQRATHARRADVVERYTEFEWRALCDEFSKLRIKVRDSSGFALES
jgi:hypothetical protein